MSEDYLTPQNTLLHNIRLMDKSMSKMVEREDEEIEKLFSSIRLQIENLEAKIVPLTGTRPDRLEEMSEENLEDEFEDEGKAKYWKMVRDAEKEFEKGRIDYSKTRSYMSDRLKAIYFLLSRKGIWSLEGIKEVEDDPIEVEE